MKRDGRRNDGRIQEAWEAEALGQGPVTAILRARLDDMLPEPLADVHEREEQERAEVRRLLGL